MPAISTGIGLAIGGALGAAGGIGGAAIASHGATAAANAQVQGADYAAELQHEDAQAALAFQQQVYGNQQAEIAPYLQMGESGLVNLGSLLGLSPDRALALSPGGSSSSGAPVSAAGPGFNAGPNSDAIRTRGGGFRGAPTSNLRYANENGTPTIPNRGATTTTSSLASLINPSLGAPGSLLQSWDTPFVAPTAATEQNDPGYAFRRQQGEQALENSAAARGGLLSTGTAKNLIDYNQNYASNEYQNVYNRALGQYQQQYNIFQNNQANKFNRLAAISGVGQTAASQLGSSGNAAAGNTTSILLGSGAQIGQQLNNAAAARASGYAATGNLFGGAFSGGLNNIGQLLALQNLFGSQYGSPNATGTANIPVYGQESI